MRRRSTGASKKKRSRRATGRHLRKKKVQRSDEGEPDLATALDQFHHEQIAGLAEVGFNVASSLPTCHEKQLRPTLEIAQRLMVIKCLMAWVCIPKDKAPNKQIQECISKNKLAGFMSDEEKEMFQTKRSQVQEQHMDNIGWKFEHAWPLAWILGFEELPDYYGHMLEGAQIKSLLIDFAPSMAEDLIVWIEQQEVVSDIDVTMVEHTFYCIHNAVRSAQLGRDTVPDGFNPLVNGGVIHERRHALSWALSPNVSWDETDLST